MPLTQMIGLRRAGITSVSFFSFFGIQCQRYADVTVTGAVISFDNFSFAPVSISWYSSSCYCESPSNDDDWERRSSG